MIIPSPRQSDVTFSWFPATTLVTPSTSCLAPKSQESMADMAFALPTNATFEPTIAPTAATLDGADYILVAVLLVCAIALGGLMPSVLRTVRQTR